MTKSLKIFFFAVCGLVGLLVLAALAVVSWLKLECDVFYSGSVVPPK